MNVLLAHTLAAATCDPLEYPHSVNVYIYKWNKTYAKK